MDELEALVALNSTPLLGPVRIRAMLHHFGGSAIEAFQASPSSLQEIPGISPKMIESLTTYRQQGRWRQDLEEVERAGADLIPFNDARYPKRLSQLPDAPVVLYVKGALQPCDERCLAIIGTRDASIYGMEMSKKLSADLVQQGFTIVSGLARGIDTAAHQAALEVKVEPSPSLALVFPISIQGKISFWPSGLRNKER